MGVTADKYHNMISTKIFEKFSFPFDGKQQYREKNVTIAFSWQYDSVTKIESTDLTRKSPLPVSITEVYLLVPVQRQAGGLLEEHRICFDHPRKNAIRLNYKKKTTL